MSITHRDQPAWVRSLDPHMDGTETVCVSKHHDGRPGVVCVEVPAGYALVRVQDESEEACW